MESIKIHDGQKLLQLSLDKKAIVRLQPKLMVNIGCIQRTDDYLIHPEKDYEKVGEVNDVCFVEGLVYFNKKWFLHYGTADSKIAVAVLEE